MSKAHYSASWITYNLVHCIDGNRDTLEERIESEEDVVDLLNHYREAFGVDAQLLIECGQKEYTEEQFLRLREKEQQ